MYWFKYFKDILPDLFKGNDISHLFESSQTLNE